MHVRRRGSPLHRPEVAAQGHLLTRRLVRQLTALRDQRIRWLLVERASRLLPELSPRMSRTAERVLRARGVEVRTGQSIGEARADCLRLSTGEEVATQSLIWCVGVRRSPRGDARPFRTERGQLGVDPTSRRARPPRRFSPAATAPPCQTSRNLGRPGDDRPTCGKAGQPRITQRCRVARRRGAHAVSASRPRVSRRPRRTSSCGKSSGRAALRFAAKSLTRAYHLYSLPGNRTRTAADWAINTVMPPLAVQLGLVDAADVRLDCTVRSFVEDGSTMVAESSSQFASRSDGQLVEDLAEMPLDSEQMTAAAPRFRDCTTRPKRGALTQEKS